MLGALELKSQKLLLDGDLFPSPIMVLFGYTAVGFDVQSCVGLF